MSIYYKKKDGGTLMLDDIINILEDKIHKAKVIDEKLISLIEYRDAFKYLKSGVIREFLEK